ncbi:hypothetical protein [Halorientalis marina]|uniref:hypothetical protein n=1 Tax=Halorientalis marina TaxID=2931976 RepID=UPI001FF5C5B9|nr:hypothetical protein [Halorientalis marina]
MEDIVEKALAAEREKTSTEDGDDIELGPPEILLVGVGAGGIDRLQAYEVLPETETAMRAHAESTRSVVVPISAAPDETERADHVVSLAQGVQPTARRSRWTAGQQRAHDTRRQLRDHVADADYCLLTVDTTNPMAMGAATEIARLASQADALPVSIPVVNRAGGDTKLSRLIDASASVVPVDTDRVTDHVDGPTTDGLDGPTDRVADLFSVFVRVLTGASCGGLDRSAWHRQLSNGGLGVLWTGSFPRTADLDSEIPASIDPLFESEYGRTSTVFAFLLLGAEVTRADMDVIEQRVETVFDPAGTVSAVPDAEQRGHTLAANTDSEVAIDDDAVHVSLVQFVDDGTEGLRVVR